MMMMTRVNSGSPAQNNELRQRLVSDDEILSSFDPVVEGSTFQVMEEGLDLNELARLDHEEALLHAPEVLQTFDLASALSKIPNKLFFRIGEVAELLDLKTYVLRFWETEFKNISPTKSRSGQRIYRKKDVESLFLIKHLLYVERFSIEGARKRLREVKGKSASIVKEAKPNVVYSESRSSEVKSTLESLKQLANKELKSFFRF